MRRLIAQQHGWAHHAGIASAVLTALLLLFLELPKDQQAVIICKAIGLLHPMVAGIRNATDNPPRTSLLALLESLGTRCEPGAPQHMGPPPPVEKPERMSPSAPGPAAGSHE